MVKDGRKMPEYLNLALADKLRMYEKKRERKNSIYFPALIAAGIIFAL